MISRGNGLRAIVGGVVAALLVSQAAAEPGGKADYSLHIRPILAERCFACHGPDQASRQAGLRLDQWANAVAAGESGAVAIVPGQPTKSELLVRVESSDRDLRMPPVDSGEPLTPQQTAALRQWIAEGAHFAEHWSFRPVVRPEPPAVSDVAWPRNAIDHFILARLDQAAMVPSPPASRETLIRRLSFDLLGLPPTPQEVDEFNANGAPDAYERLVDRLLASPHFGERWGRHWLDLAHYADSDGYLGDALRPYAWRYRDWVIDAINRDLPLDEFAIEQLAGDLLPDATLAQRTATGMLRNSLRNTEAGVDLEEYRVKEIVDRVSTVGTAWLGLSIGCAECHSHKYDPISHREFYELFSFFNNADDVDLPAPLPGLQERYEANLHDWSVTEMSHAVTIGSVWPTDAPADAKEVLTVLAIEAKKRSSEQKKFVDSVQKSVDADLRKELLKYEQHAAKKPRPPAPKVLTIGGRKTERPTFVHLRGDYRSQGELVAAGTPEVLPPLRARGEQADRLDFARWLVAPEHPLTPRVTMNYLWKHLFGQGLVATVDNFGAGGEAPSHPDLLDWLASELPARRASRKSLIRTIAASATYRQSSAGRADLARHDPLNKLLARQGRFRLEAEAVRDATLSVSGLLTRQIGGEGIRPPQPAYVTSISRNAEWPVSTGSDLHRRGMYIVFRRATPYPMLLTFDTPDSTVACARRERTNSPLQALTLLNDPVFFTAAQALGRELADGSLPADDDRLREAYQRCLGRSPQAAELDRLRSMLAEERTRLENDVKSARETVGPAISSDTAASAQAAWVLVARVLMNLDEFITRE